MKKKLIAAILIIAVIAAVCAAAVWSKNRQGSTANHPAETGSVINVETEETENPGETREQSSDFEDASFLNEGDELEEIPFIVEEEPPVQPAPEQPASEEEPVVQTAPEEEIPAQTVPEDNPQEQPVPEQSAAPGSNETEEVPFFG